MFPYRNIFLCFTWITSIPVPEQAPRWKKINFLHKLLYDYVYTVEVAFRSIYTIYIPCSSQCSHIVTFFYFENRLCYVLGTWFIINSSELLEKYPKYICFWQLFLWLGPRGLMTLWLKLLLSTYHKIQLCGI